MRLAAVSLLLLAAGGCGGHPAPREAPGPTLVAVGDGELWQIDADTGRTRHVVRPDLPGGDPPHRILRRGDRFVLWPVPGSAFFLPSAHADRLWLVSTGRTQVRAVREVTVDGAVLVPASRPPGWPEAATLAGLAVSRRDGVLIWNPRTDTVVRRLGRLGDLGGTWRNLITSCARPCRELRVTHARTGAQVRIPAPRGDAFEAHAAAFSPDGDRIAVLLRSHRATRRLALVDRLRRTAAAVPGSRVPAGYTFVAWSRSGGDVFFTGGTARSDRVIVRFRVGDARATRVRARVGAFYDIAAR